MKQDVIKFFRKQDVISKELSRAWSEGLPLGNGDMGVMVLEDGNPLKLTIDKAEVWDTRNPEWNSSFRFNRAKESYQAGNKDNPALLIIKESLFRYPNSSKDIRANKFGYYKVLDSLSGRFQPMPDISEMACELSYLAGPGSL